MKVQVGQDVWYRARSTEAGPYPGNAPLAAIITSVEGDRVNLFVFSKIGTPHGVQNVPFLAEGSLAGGGYAQPQGGAHVEPDAAEPLPDDAKLGEIVEGEKPGKKGFFGKKDK